MFVRPAESYADQNCVAYQYGLDIYFTITRNIEARAEIKVWLVKDMTKHIVVQMAMYFKIFEHVSTDTMMIKENSVTQKQ